jgi:hypothetical protein
MTSYPPGFEGPPRYKQITPIEKQTMTKYTDIQATCAKKLNIFLPMSGYCHHMIEEDNVEKLYEMAYHREFRSKPPVINSYNPPKICPISRGCSGRVN